MSSKLNWPLGNDLALRILALSTPNEFEAVFRDASGVDALIQIDDAMFTSHRRTLVELATKYRIPGSTAYESSWISAASWRLGPVTQTFTAAPPWS